MFANFTKKTKGSIANSNSPSQTVTDFVAKSRKCQILYANREGPYSRRVISLKDKGLLENFIYSTLCYEGVSDSKSEQRVSKLDHVQKILNKICLESERFNLDQEIHISVIWIYFFSYVDKTQRSTPIFKIYKKKSGDEAVFLDVELNLYQNWNSCLDNGQFPHSLLCVPRDGAYSFLGDNKVLDLEYICAVKSNPSNIKNENYAPFSHRAVRSLLTKDFIKGKIKGSQNIILAESSNLIKVGKISLVFVEFVVQLLVNILEGEQSEIEKHLQCLGQMNDPSNKNVIQDSQFISFTRLSDVTLGLGDFSKLVVNVINKTLILIELLQTNKKHWRKIISFFCFMLVKNFSVLNRSLNLEAYIPPVIEILFLLLHGILTQKYSGHEKTLVRK